MNFPAGVTEADALKHLSTRVDANLAQVLQEAGVPVALQYNLTVQFQTVRRFSAYEDSRTGLRQALKADFSLEPDDLARRAAIASVISAWEAAGQLNLKETELKAEARILGVAKPLTQTDRAAMRLAFETSHGKLEEQFEPSEDYLAAKMDEIETHEPVASPLSEVTSRRTAKTQGLQTSLDAGGQIRVVKSRQKGTLPQGTEELRTVLRVEANLWCMLAAKYRNKEFLRGMEPGCWADYVGFLLGEKCYLMKVPTPSGKGQPSEHVSLRPPWSVMITFEHELRKEAIKRAVSGNRPLAETITEVTKDAQLKEQFFTSPIALQPRLQGGDHKRTWNDRWNDMPDSWVDRNTWQRTSWKGKKGDKGRKGGSKGKDGKHWRGEQKGGKGSENQLISRTADGREICFPYNAQGCDGSCGRVHICRVRGCGQAHAMWQHYQALSAKVASAKASGN